MDLVQRLRCSFISVVVLLFPLANKVLVRKVLEMSVLQQLESQQRDIKERIDAVEHELASSRADHDATEAKMKSLEDRLEDVDRDSEQQYRLEDEIDHVHKRFSDLSRRTARLEAELEELRIVFLALQHEIDDQKRAP